MEFDSTREITIPLDPFEKIIGQENVVRIARLVPHQRRHLLLVGPPGTGKSMIARAISSVLSVPSYEISVLHNTQCPERPLVELRTSEQISQKNDSFETLGTNISPDAVPFFVAERLGYMCRRCGELSDFKDTICNNCGADKFSRSGFFDENNPYNVSSKVYAKRRLPNGNEEELLYKRKTKNSITVFTQEDIKKLNDLKKKSMRKIIVPLSRVPFVQSSGASETELLGDVSHDPYGSHHELGTQPYQRVVAGAVHEAHEGILFLDELSTLGEVQRHILTAMQDNLFPIVGRNPTSSGSIVRVDNVPCDFLLVGAVNINDLSSLLPALRSRIRGQGYEVLMNSYMDDTKENRKKFYQFIAQEIYKDGKIPHASCNAVKELLTQSKNITKAIDKKNGISLRLRNISGLLRLAGDLAISEQAELIERNHVAKSLVNSQSIEQQLSNKYSNWWEVSGADYGPDSYSPGPETA